MRLLSQQNKDFLNKKTAIIRVDFNVPIVDGKITDNKRILKALPTIKYILDNGGKVVLISHLGRPKGEGFEESLSLQIVQKELEQLLKQDVLLIKDYLQDNTKQTIQESGKKIVLLENIRFFKEEKKGDTDFAKKIATLGDYYVGEAFSAAHRKHASIYNLALEMEAFGGFLMEEELTMLGKIMENPKKPSLAIIGGSKVSTKIDVLTNLSQKVETIIVAGAMAITFLKCLGKNIGNSLHEDNMEETIKKIFENAKANNCNIILPKDFIVSKGLEDKNGQNKTPETMVDDDNIFDIGQESIEAVKNIIAEHNTVVWNGPFGVFEVPPFDRGTNTIGEFVAKRTKENGLISIAGGGDTLSALKLANVLEDLTYYSTAGGAFLEYIEGKTLPGVEVLCTK